jgi:predicted phage terminase large subunit-like protein
MSRITQKDLEAFIQKCKRIEESSLHINLAETLQDKQTRIERAKKDYNYFFTTYLRHYCLDDKGQVIDCAEGHIEVAKFLRKNRLAKIAWEAHRGYAKSVHSTVGIPLWLKIQGELKFMVIVGENQDKATLLLSDIQAELHSNLLYINDFGIQKSVGDWSDGSFVTKDGSKFLSLGLSQDPAGLRKGANRPDYIVCDDLDTLQKCNNQRIIRESVEWITSILMGCFSTSQDSRERFVLANNRIHNKSILIGFINEMQKDKNFRHYKVNALDAKGNVTWSRYTKEYWAEKARNTPYRAFQRNYMNNPIQDGKLFSETWVHYKPILPLHKYECIVGYWDFSYVKQGDYKAFVLIGKVDGKKEYHILTTFCRQCEGKQAANWFYELDRKLTKKGVTAINYIEGNASQEQVYRPIFDEVGHEKGFYVPLVFDTRVKGNKFTRVESTLTSPFSNNEIYFASYLEHDADTIEAVGQLLAFEQGSNAHDDFPDALEGALFKLMRATTNTDGRGEAVIKERKRKGF